MANNFHETFFTDSQLEEIFLFWACADRSNFLDLGINIKLFLSKWNEKGMLSPFKTIRNMVDKVNLPLEIKNFGIQDYNDKAITFIMIAFSGLNLRTCSIEDLLKIKGMKKRSINCFLTQTRYQDFENKKIKDDYVQNEYEKIIKENTKNKIEESNECKKDFIDLDLWNLFRKNKR